MSDSVATPDPHAALSDTAPAAPPRQTRWALIGIVAAITIVVALVVLVSVRALISVPYPEPGVVDADKLILGSCLAEDSVDAAQYTVVDCSQAHPQQVVADIDLTISTADYTHFESRALYAQEVCDRFLEYGLFVPDRIADVFVRASYELRLISMPSQEQLEAGRTTTFCAIRAVDGSLLTENLYEPLPH